MKQRLELRRSLRQDREADSRACRSMISEEKRSLSENKFFVPHDFRLDDLSRDDDIFVIDASDRCNGETRLRRNSRRVKL